MSVLNEYIFPFDVTDFTQASAERFDSVRISRGGGRSQVSYSVDFLELLRICHRSCAQGGRDYKTKKGLLHGSARYPDESKSICLSGLGAYRTRSRRVNLNWRFRQNYSLTLAQDRSMRSAIVWNGGQLYVVVRWRSNRHLCKQRGFGSKPAGSRRVSFAEHTNFTHDGCRGKGIL
jgi:hypothetical protein